MPLWRELVLGLRDGMKRKRSWRNLVAAIIVLVPVIGFVIYSSLQVGKVECEVCMSFEGRELCRAASAKTAVEAARSAAENACALLTSGMTNTIRCQQSEPVRTRCGSVNEAG